MLIIGQCTTAVKNKIEANKDYSIIEQDYNVIELLKLIKMLHLKVERRSTTIVQPTKQ